MLLNGVAISPEPLGVPPVSDEAIGRLVQILALICSEAGLNAQLLAERCGCSVRQVYRDIARLNSLGFHILFEGGPGRKGAGRKDGGDRRGGGHQEADRKGGAAGRKPGGKPGYRLVGDFPIPVLQLTLGEAVSLAVAAAALKEREHAHYGDAIASAYEKVTAVIPEAARRMAAEAALRIWVDPHPLGAAGGSGNAEQFAAHAAGRAALPLIERAVLDRHRVRMRYHSLSSQTIRERDVDPYGAVFRDRAWYLVGFDHDNEEIRKFRVDRILDLRVLPTRFERPPEFNLEQYMSSAWSVEHGPELRVRIRFDREVALLVREAEWHPTQELAERPDGGVVMSVRVSGRGEIARWVLGFGGRAEVLEPPELRELVAEMARGAAERYGAMVEQGTKVGEA